MVVGPFIPVAIERFDRILIDLALVLPVLILVCIVIHPKVYQPSRWGEW